MKTTSLTILLALIFITACKKSIIYEDRTACCFSYEIQGSFNGQNWQRNGWQFGAAAIDRTQTIKDTSSVDYKCVEGLVGFSLGLMTKEHWNRESLAISNVPKKAQKYGVLLNTEDGYFCPFSRDSIVASFIVLTDDGDFSTDRYKRLDKNYPNSFEVISYEPVKNEFKCKFDFAFIKTTKIDPTYPDTLYLKGEFRIEGRYKG